MGVGTFYLTLLLALAVSTAHSHYVAMFPSTFRPGWDYKVEITVVNTKGGSSVTVRADIQDSRNQSLASSSGTIQNGETKTLMISISPSFEPAEDNQYSLKLQGTGGLTFVNTTSIQLEVLTTLTFVQTDKGIYKPSDLVRFRVLTVDRDLKPQKVSRTITVKNPAGSGLRKYVDDGSKAVFEDTFQLTEFPDLGQWKIEVKSEENNIEVEFPFEVDEYVLPKFEVTAVMYPTFLVRGKGQTLVTVNVMAKYTYGKGVTGDIKVTTGRKTIHGKIMDNNGMKEVEIDLADDLKDEQMRYSSQLTLTVEVTDSTQRTYSTSGVVKISSQPYVVEFDKERSDTVFRSGTQPRIVVKVTDPSGQALGSDFSGNLVVTLKDSTGREVNEHTVFPVTAGTMYFVKTFDPVMTTVNSLTAVATLTDVETDERYTSTLYLQKFETVGNSSLNVRVAQDDQPYVQKMYHDIAMQVDAYPTDGFQMIRYMVVSRGSVQMEGSVGDSGFLTVVSSPELCPQADVIVYGLTKVTTGSALPEVIADHLTFSLSGCQDKELKPSVTENSLRTGSDATIKMDIEWTDDRETAKVGQHDVFMLAVDKSILLLQGSDHDLSPSRVDQELRKFTLGSGSQGGGGGPIMDARPGIWPPPYPGQTQTTTGQLLRTVGLVVMSDVVMEDTAWPPYHDGDIVAFAMPGDVQDDGDMMERAEMVPDVAQGGSGQAPAKVTTVRKDFPDTWIWKTGQTNENGKMTMVEKLPDSITSWVISAFALKEDSDLVVTKNPFDLRAFNPFFVDLNLPYSIRRNEIFILRCTVFHYDPEVAMMQGMVKLRPSPDFDINNGDSKPFMVKRNEGVSVEFNITAKTVKTINITVTASDKNQRYTDIVTKMLIVKPEGEARSDAVTIPVVLTASQPTFEREVTITYPTSERIVPQSKRVTVKITADMMGNVLNNVEDLVTQPTGCGEQNMITTIPNIYAMKYLVAIGDTSADFNETAKGYMAKGYQKETIQYRHDAGYSAFGRSDPEPSTWLTAFVVRSFAQANLYIPSTVDLGLLGEDVDYILSTWSNERRIFLELGKVLHDDMQGGSGAGDALTVYVTMCLIEAKMAGIMVDQGQVDKAFEKVKDTAQDVLTMASGSDEKEKKLSKNLFLAAITAYTLTLKKPVDEQTVTALINYINSTGAPWKEEEAERPAPGDGMRYHSHQAGPSAIEITSYCILAYLGLGPGGVDSAKDLVMWLQTKQSSLGGYSSTQDTVLALQAISEYAAVFSKAADSRIEIILLEPPGETRTININNNNKRILQIVELPPEIMKLKIKVTGSTETFSLVKVVWNFHTMPKSGDDKMKLTSELQYIQSDLQSVKTCINMKDGFEYNNMLLVTVDSPSCWGLDDILEVRKDNPKVKRVEQDQNLVHFYLNQAENTCLMYKMTKQCEIQNAQPGSAVAYAYYKPDELRAEVDLKVIECTENCNDGPSSVATPLSRVSGLLLTAVICLLLSLLVAT